MAQTTIEVSGDITENTTWFADTVMVTGDITILDDVILVIEPGTCIQVNGKYRFDIQGTLDAAGLPGDTILFTCHPDSTASGWNGLYIRDLTGSMMDNDSTVISHCKFEYGNQRDGNSGGCITVYAYSRVKVKNSLFQNNSGVHSGIYCRSNANILIAENYFTKNNATNAIFCFNADPVIERNWFVDGSGMLDLETGSSAIIRNNFFGKNTFNIRCYSSDPLITGNIICNNYQAIELFESPAILVNNTICNNDYGIRCRGDIRPIFYNTIIFGNTNYEVYLEDFGSQPDIYYCDIESGNAFPGNNHTGAYQNNLNILPDFKAPSSGAGVANYDPAADWSLKVSSSLLNTGTPDVSGLKLKDKDIMGSLRISYNRIDIGAVEYHQNSISACGSTPDNITWYADTVKITCDYTILDFGKLNILPGTVVEFQGNYKLKVLGTIYAIGREENPILFTVHDSAGFSNPDTTLGGWGSLIFNNGSPADGGANGAMSDNDSSILRFCRFEYSKKSGSGWEANFGGAVFISSFSNLDIEDCIFICNYAKYGGAIAARNSILKTARCKFMNNQSVYGGGIYIDNTSWFEIRDCIFHQNTASGDGGAIYTWLSYGQISGNILSNNQANSGGGIKFYVGEGGNVINNLICNNQAIFGGGIYLEDSPGFTFTNNTITNNKANYGGGIYLNRTAPDVYNSVLWGNSPDQFYLFNLKSQPSVYHSNIQGGTEGFTGSQYIGIAQHVLDSLPYFTNSSEGTGMLFDGLTADWSILPVSPCINEGMMNIPDISLPDIDLAGNNRIHDYLIDIGAYENQSVSPIITEQPQNHIKCLGYSIAFSVKTLENSFLQWQKDGIDIPGATADQYIIDTLIANHEGNYQCLVSNEYGTIKSNNAFLQVRVPPEILSQAVDMWVERLKPASIGFYANGTNLAYKWTKNDTLIPGAISPEFLISKADFGDEGQYSCILSNSCGTDTTSQVGLYIAPQICMVTISETTGNNLVVWEKKSNAPIMAYNVYRESVAAGIYDLMKTIPYDDLSVFIDTNADPTVQAYLYKITAIDAAGNETDIDLCKPHKTVHLIVSTNPELNTTQLQWDRYYGFDYQTYTIYRSNTGLNFDPVGSLSANLNSWTDPDPSSGDQFYRIAVEKPDPCTPEGNGKKAGTGPYHHSLSNMDDNKLRAGEIPPDTITLSMNSIQEKNMPGMMIGKLFTLDKDSLDSHTYKFVPGDGDDDNISFSILSDLLLASESFDYETKNQYSVRIRSTDEAGNYCEIPFIIHILDVDETTGLPILNEGGVRAFPNPFNQSTTIRFPNQSHKAYKMALTDLSGKVYRIVEDITTSEYVMEKGDLKNGLYFIELRGPKIYRGKIVIE